MSRFVLHSTRVVTASGVGEQWVVVDGEQIVDILDSAPSKAPIKSFGQTVLMPRLVDSHVHINEPGRTDWEGFFTTTQAAIASEVTTVVDMPLNCMPVTTTVETLHAKFNALGQQLHSDIRFWGGVVPGNQDELMTEG